MRRLSCRHLVSRAIAALVGVLAACTPAKETGITMERLAAGDYQTIAKCVNRTMMRQASADYMPQFVDYEDEKAAELWSVHSFFFSPNSKLEEQRIQQEGDHVRMITYLPPTMGGQNQMRQQVGAYWDRCAQQDAPAPVRK